MKKLNKKYIISFLIPFILLGLIYFSLGFFFNKTLFVSDMAGQYKMLFTFLKDNFFASYSFSKGLGGTMIGTYAYYLMSPFNFIMFLFPKNSIHIAVLLIVWLKLSLSGTTMYFYLNKTFPNKKNLVLFSTCYALMGYTAAYYFHVMWLDAVLMLPILVYGLDKIINNKSPLLYFISLLIIIYCNYYIAYMICIFSIIYFIYKSFITYDNNYKKRIKEPLKKFIISSLLAGLSVSFLLIPTYLEFQNMPKSDMNVFARYPLEISTNLYDFLSQLFIGNHNYANILANNFYFIYVGIFTFILVLLYFMNNKINKREKKASFIVILIFLISIFVNYVDYIWHGFNIPVCFYGRYVFILSFFVIILAVKCFINIDGITKKKLWIIAPIYPIIGTIVLFGNLDTVKIPLIFVSVFLFFIYLLLINFKINRSVKNINLLIFLLVIAELFFNYYFMINDYGFRFKKETLNEYATDKKQINEIKSKDSDKFYRIGKIYARSPADSLYFNYFGNVTFLSTVGKNEMEFLGRAGYNVHDNMAEYLGFNPILDSLLGIKYVITEEDIDTLEKINQYKGTVLYGELYDVFKKDIYVYKNNEALSLGTVISNDLSKCNIKNDDGDRLKYQNQIVNCLTGVDDIYEKIELEKIDDNTYSFTNTKKLDFYSFANIKSDYLTNNKGITLYINEIKLSYYSNKDFAIQKFKNDADIGVKFTYKIEGNVKNVKPVSYYFNKEKYEEVFDKLNKNQLKISELKNGYIKGNATGENKNSYLFTTIPYDKGWHIFIDGKKINYDKIFDTFIGFKIGEGKHNIEFKYVPIGLKEGILISILSIFLALIYFSREGKKHMKKNINDIFNKIINLYKKYKEIINYGIFGVLTTLVNIISYFVLAKIFGIQYLISNIIAIVLSILFAYITNRIFVFESKNKNILKELILFFYYRLISSIIDMSIMYIFVSVLKFDDMIIKIVSNIIVILLNYVFSKLFIFKNK